ncbi:unnamed protein product [Cylicostephanus goldi]|uniref:CCHC-type domain-containing protein n=1 Tax=Cylicostephanus goldi TaxID=71465 RepID=A0A3P6TW17_CYLGO|nr:unnamed protein product [Cylicostephanus goldi]
MKRLGKLQIDIRTIHSAIYHQQATLDYLSQILDNLREKIEEGNRNAQISAQELQGAISNLTTTVEKALENLRNGEQATNIDAINEEGEGAGAKVEEEAPIEDNNMVEKQANEEERNDAAAEPKEEAVSAKEEKKEERAQLGHEARTIQSNQDYIEVLEIEMEDASLSDEVDEAKERQEVEIMEEPVRAEPEREELLIPEEAQLHDEELLVPALELELGQNRQAIADLNLMIEELENQKTCWPRRYHGKIQKSCERNMSCAFCNEIGDHYSDSCTEIPTGRERREVLNMKRRCATCLEYCSGGDLCKKAYDRCSHCHETGHHSALCELPDTSQDIFQRLEQAKESRERHFQRIDQIQMELQDLRQVPLP